MDQALSITLALAALATIVLVLRFLATWRRKRELRRRFGEEYDRLVRERGERDERGDRFRKLERKKKAG